MKTRIISIDNPRSLHFLYYLLVLCARAETDECQTSRLANLPSCPALVHILMFGSHDNEPRRQQIIDEYLNLHTAF
jgi:hypothetical protein